MTAMLRLVLGAAAMASAAAFVGSTGRARVGLGRLERGLARAGCQRGKMVPGMTLEGANPLGEAPRLQVEGAGPEGTVLEAPVVATLPSLPAPLQAVRAAMRGPQREAMVNYCLLSAVALLVTTNVLSVDAAVNRGWTLQEALLRIPVDNWHHYMDALRDHPIFVKACTSLSVYCIGDLAAQLLGGIGLDGLDRNRMARSGAVGFVGHGPLSHFWYILCDSTFAKFGVTAWWSVFPKVAVDQLLWGPIWNALYVFATGILARESPQASFDKVKRTSVPLIKQGVKLWVPTHLVTYGLIPQENRLLWVDSVEILWCIILATTAAGAVAAHAAGLGADEAATSGEELAAAAADLTPAVEDALTLGGMDMNL